MLIVAGAKKYSAVGRKCLQKIRTCGIIPYMWNISTNVEQLRKMEMQEKTRKVDRRIQKTRTAIHQAFVSLLVGKPLEKITIKEVAENANVDRKTIYNYYDGVYDILDYLENEMINRIEGVMAQVGEVLKDPLRFFEAINQVLSENIVFCNHLMRVDSNSRLVVKIISFLREKIWNTILENNEVDRAHYDFAAEFLTAGMFYSYRAWFNSDRKKPLAQLSQEIGEMIRKVLSSLEKAW